MIVDAFARLIDEQYLSSRVTIGKNLQNPKPITYVINEAIQIVRRTTFLRKPVNVRI